MKWRRRAVQIIIFVLYIFLFLKTTYQGEDVLSYPVNIFLRLDPLIALVTMISVRKVISGFIGAFLLLAATFILGRFFCGWVCPLGTFLDFVSSIFYRKIGAVREPPLQDKKYRWKYYLFIFLLISSVFSLQLIFLFDPISLLTRSFTISVYPAFSFLFSNGRFFPLSIKKAVFLDTQPVFLLNIFIALIFIVIIFLEKFGRRFWCRNLCPLGAMFGLVSRFALFRRVVGEGCNDCGLCGHNCKMKAIRDDVKKNLSFECIDCFTCADACSTQEVNFVFAPDIMNSKQKFDLSRRHVLISVAGGVLAVPVIKNIYLQKSELIKSMDDYLIRPPGALPEAEFLKHCTRCGECMRVCLGNALHPALTEAGLEGLWSPLLVPRLGYCEFNCTLCGQVCPTQAIKELTQPEKRKTVIGLAHFDKNRCIPYSRQTNCMVCEEHCPVSPKAIVFEETKDLTKEGEPIKLPRVIAEKCIGCGICQNKCPIQGKGAIIVTREKVIK
ncbi:MAG: 4Fe-4S binding protein [bacterium]|nr:4Fe-4S binding protein [bacterium]